MEHKSWDMSTRPWYITSYPMDEARVGAKEPDWVGCLENKETGDRMRARSSRSREDAIALCHKVIEDLNAHESIKAQRDALLEALKETVKYAQACTQCDGRGAILTNPKAHPSLKHVLKEDICDLCGGCGNYIEEETLDIAKKAIALCKSEKPKEEEIPTPPIVYEDTGM